MKIACDVCGKAVDDAMLQIVETEGQILYACPECFLGHQEHPPEEQS